MKTLLKTLLTSLLITSASAALAQNRSNQPCGWSFLIETAEFGGLKEYIDYCKITGTGRYRFAWGLSDYISPQGVPEYGFLYVSQVAKWLYDCQLSSIALTANYDYTGKMGQGAVLWSHSYPENKWNFVPVPLGSVLAKQLETVCR